MILTKMPSLENVSIPLKSKLSISCVSYQTARMRSWIVFALGSLFLSDKCFVCLFLFSV